MPSDTRGDITGNPNAVLRFFDRHNRRQDSVLPVVLDYTSPHPLARISLFSSHSTV